MPYIQLLGRVVNNYFSHRWDSFWVTLKTFIKDFSSRLLQLSKMTKQQLDKKWSPVSNIKSAKYDYLYNPLLLDMYSEYSMGSWRLCIHVCAGSSTRKSSLLQTIQGLQQRYIILICNKSKDYGNLHQKDKRD